MESSPDVPSPASSTAPGRRLALVLGPALGLAAALLLPVEYRSAAGDTIALGPDASLAAGLLVWMATWWLTEAIALEGTALLPLAVLPLGGTSFGRAAAPYAAPVIFLFLGGFLLALAMQRWQLDRRIALWTLRLVGTRPSALVAGVMVATALLSACVSNTATTAMMLPIALGVLSLYRASLPDVSESGHRNLEVALLLGTAYAASLGGLATIIGSPPTGIAVQFAAEHLGREISFVRWIAIGAPLAFLLLPATWWLLTRVLYRVPSEPLPGGRRFLAERLRELGPPARGERITAFVFALAVTAWVTRPLLQAHVPALSDAGIAVTAALALFVLPAGRDLRVLDWGTARHLPFGILLLFGGGLSLAGAIDESGVAAFLGSSARELAGLEGWVLVALVTGGMVLLTELTSNTASAATLLPVLAALAPGLGLDPLALVLPAALAASCAFMLPVATPPNAIVFGSGRVGMADMRRAGLVLNVLAAAAITAWMHWIALPWIAP